MIFRLGILIVFFLAHMNISAFAKTKPDSPIYYFPFMHAIPGGKGYEGLGGDRIFFSYIHVALEILKAPQKYEIYSEGFSIDLYRGGRYYIGPKITRKIRSRFPNGFPQHVREWTQPQKDVFVEYGPVTVLYALNKIKRIRAADREKSLARAKRLLSKCETTRYFKAWTTTLFRKIYKNWDEFYTQLRKDRGQGVSKSCKSIYQTREKYAVKRLKKHRTIIRKPLLIIYGASHDFGKYFGDKLHYLGNPILSHAAACYHHRNSFRISYDFKICSKLFLSWLETLGHKSYFSGSLPKSFAPNTVAYARRLAPDNSRGSSQAEHEKLFRACSNETLKAKSRITACNRFIHILSTKTSYDKADLYYFRAQAFFDNLQYQQAIEDLKKYVGSYPNSNKAYNLLGWAYFKKKDYVSALSHLNKAIEISPNHTNSYNRRGLTHMAVRNYTEAIKNFKKAIRLDPQYIHAYNNIGWAYFSHKKYKSAIRYYKDALKLNPQFQKVLNNLGLTYIKTKDYRLAFKYLKKAIAVNPNDAQAYNNLAWAYFKAGRPKSGLKYVQDSIKLLPKNPLAYDTRAHIYEALGDYKKALSDYKKALELNPRLNVSLAGLERLKKKVN